jgi:predicted phosphodiesterase
MKIAVLSDIHGNLEACRAVFTHLAKLPVDEIFCLGDIVGYGPQPNDCIDLVRITCTGVVMGNHDAAICGLNSLDHFDGPGRAAIRKSVNLVTPANLDYLRNLPLVMTTHDITLAHASPHRPGTWAHIHTPLAARQAFRAFPTPLCFVGHTHVPIIIDENLAESHFRKGKRLLINVGSVGLPRDGRPEAAVGILDTEGWSYGLHRITYDVGRAIDAIHKAGFPDIIAEEIERGM